MYYNDSIVKAVTRKLSQLSNEITVCAERAQQMFQDITTTQGIPQKLKHLQRGMFDMHLMHYLIKGYSSDQIAPYDDDFNRQLSEICVRKIPVSKIINDFKPDDEADLGYCFERSFLMFMCVDNAVWVQGNNKILELAHGKENSKHAWVEIGDFVYDPTTVLKYQKDFYYKMLKVSNVIKLTHKEILQETAANPSLLKMLNNYLETVQNQLASKKSTQKNDLCYANIVLSV